MRRAIDVANAANHRLQREIKDRKSAQDRTAILYAVAHVLAEAETIEEAAPKIVQALGEALGCDYGAFWRIEPTDRQLHCVEIWHRPNLAAAEFTTATRQKTFALGEGLPGRVWATAQPAWVKDVSGDENFPHAPLAVKAGLHAAFGFPLSLEHEFLGMIEFFSQEKFEPSDMLIGLLATLSSQIGQFIQRKNAQKELQHEQFLLRALMENLPDRIYFKDLQSRFLRNSKAHLQRFGLAHASDAIGKTDFDFFTEEHARQAFQDEQQLIRNGQSITKEEKETWPDGSVSWAWSTKLPLRDETGNVIGTFGISRDITDRKQAEEALRHARDEAEVANRTKSQLLAYMSQKLRMPLDSVIGYEPARDEIALAAYFLWEAAGKPAGRDQEFWQQARAKLVQEHHLVRAALLEAKPATD